MKGLPTVSASPLLGRSVRSVKSVVPPGFAQLGRDVLVRARYRSLRSQDIVLASYPKSGSTWLRMILIECVAGRTAEFDTLDVLSPPLGERSLSAGFLPGSGRLIKSHEPFRRMVPGAPRATIYLVRDGRDVAVSYYHHFQRNGIQTSSFSAFLGQFLASGVDSYGSWQKHVEGWWARAQVDSRIITVQYEDLLKAPSETVRTCLREAGLPISDEAIAASVEANQFSRMKAKEEASITMRSSAKGSGSFVRSGTANNWPGLFSQKDEGEFGKRAGKALSLIGYEN